MASLQLQHPRGRAAANSSRPLQPRAPTAAVGGTTQLNGSPGVAAAASTLSIFLTNLRLLDLDLLPDWPDITPQVFAASGTGAPGQKRRIQCVEWALFRLFSLWDPEESANKLKPFFPPLEQIQSVNLRAALYRALENAKKSGILGRDAVLRKTMLDECKGERLEEVLAYFSTAVLKRVMAQELENAGCHPAVAAGIVFEQKGYQSNNSQLVALALAHRTSLRQCLNRKEATRSSYRDFADFLNVKERTIARRAETARDREQRKGRAAMSDNAKAEMRRTVRNNWSGNDDWMNVLLGDSGERTVDLLEQPFELVWRRVQQGRLGELEESGESLLEQLDHRVRIQKERLKRWDDFRAEAFTKQREKPQALQRIDTKNSRGLDFGFTNHQDLQVGTSTKHISANIKRGRLPLSDDYESLVNGLRDKLAQIRSRKTTASDVLTTKQPYLPATEEQGAISEMSEFEDDAAGKSIAQDSQPKSVLFGAQGRFQSFGDTCSPSVKRPEVIKEDLSAAQFFDSNLQEIDSAERKNLWKASSSSNPSPRRSPVHPSGFAPNPAWPSPLHEAPSAQELASRILESVEPASPSPSNRTKPRPTLSLTQRTRLSLAKVDSLFLEDDEPESPLDSAPLGKTMSMPRLAEGMKTPGEEDSADYLVSRTRRSMAGFEKAKKKAQLERRRSLRKSKALPRRDGSLFPPVDEDDSQERSHLAEELMCEEDMEAVFRSRPRIKASPIPSPTRDWTDESCE
ncbi:hypothetical protein HIM_06152 [Hirsutella minnesotensis 3608]|uniref:HAUS augmin-like complex subunit 6 N-terminal domain-containing protein n=1 Tax=Hirsutella minnesotensis 3608 TaxID=1043627 RepID=A0A0F7ZJM8_9HYPO|nr:hypothetical protein HIM_06152 [Hirsutella minnesotensis 3608]